jgi:hypothetical protein
MRSPDRLGYYLVNKQKYYNKTLALLASRQHSADVKWVFNDDIFGKVDWTDPIAATLPELYLRRAQQLRERYDYLVLYFSGGADSGNILHTFLSNGIFLDEIVMQLPEPMRETFDPTDRSMRNNYAEIEYSAIPFLNRYTLDPRTRVRYQDFAAPVIELFNHDDWFDTNPIGTNLCVSGIARQYTTLTERHILELCERDIAVGQILGVDKPHLTYDNAGNYYFYFSDTSAMHALPMTADQKDVFNNRYHTEFFYWTPDLPEIVVKQAQSIKAYCETNAQARQLLSTFTTRHLKEFKPLLHPIIYPQEIHIEFETDKPSSRVLRPMDDWFWATAGERAIDNYLSAIKYLGKNIDARYLIDGNIDNGIASHQTIMYKL